MKLLITGLFAAIAFGVSSSPMEGRSQARTPGEDAIHAIHARYGGAWLRTVTFVQKSTFADGRVETWFESLQLPGKLRVDYAPASNGRAILLRNDSLYSFVQGTARPPRAFTNTLLVALYDIHAQPPATTAATMQRLGYNLSAVHRRTWNGDSVIVIGALEGDTASRQVWFEVRRMIAVRTMDPGPQGVQDAHIGGYVAVGRYWHEREIRLTLGGRPWLLEQYHDVRTNDALPAALFEPTPAYVKPAWIGDGQPRW